MLQLADDEEARYPQAEILRKNRYADDFFATLLEAIVARDQLTAVLSCAGMHIGK